MKLSTIAVALAWAFFPYLGEAQNLSDPAVVAMIAELEAAVPTCAFNCIVEEVSLSTCAVTDNACICTNPTLATQIQTCLATGCTVIEQLQTVKFQTSNCGGPVHNTSNRLKATTWALFPIVIIFVICRIIARLPAMGGELSQDDYMIIIATIGVIGTSVVCQELVNYGLGRDMWELTPDQITHTLLYFFTAEVLYAFVVLTTKLSILMFYMRIFTKKSFRIQCYILMGISCAHALAGWLAQPFICRPTSFFWQGWDGQHSGTCPININKQTYAMASTNIGLDVLIFLIPIPQLWPLQMSSKKKMGVALMFLVGLLETLCSIIRMWTITVWGRTTNPTLDYLSLGLWSIIEIDVGVICACMPGMASLLRRISPRVFGTLRGSSKGTANSDDIHTYERRMGSSAAKNKISKTTNVSVTFGSESERDSKDDDYELLARVPSQTPLRQPRVELNNMDKNEYRNKW